MENKTEKSFKDFLKNIPNEQLIDFYDEVEWTPFPILVIDEYQRRFKVKNTQEVKEKLKRRSELARYRNIITNKIKSKSKSLQEKTKRIYSKQNLELLEKLSELKKKGIITNKEFQEKKDELLKRI